MAADADRPRVQLRTLGCRLNQAESDELRDAFAAAGAVAVPTDEPADVIVVNTCTVTSEASKASRSLIRRAVRDHPEATVVVTGCYAVADPDVVAQIAGVDAVVPNKDKDVIVAGVLGDRATAPVAVELGSPRANLKVQTGCDESCAFCIVPTTRGGLQSRDVDAVLGRARLLAAMGVAELVLTGVHLGKYGHEHGVDRGLHDLLDRLRKVDGIRRIRLSSIEASQVDEALLELLASDPVFCPHLHLPLQTGDDALWRRMRRPGTLDHFLTIARAARVIVPDMAITTDVMVGYPGETEAAFQATLDVVEAVGFEKLHVFRFSARPGTPAAELGDQVPPEVKKARSARLRALGDAIRRRWHEAQVGRTVTILVEQAGPERPSAPGRPSLTGLTGNYLRVVTSGPAGAVGREVEVRVERAGRESVEGAIVGGLPVLQDRGR